MTESITKAAQAMQFVTGDLLAAARDAAAVERPEGQSVRDRALAAYLADCLDLARKLEQKLRLIAD